MKRCCLACLCGLTGLTTVVLSEGLIPLGIAENIQSVTSINAYNQVLVWTVTNTASTYTLPGEFDLVSLPGFVPVETNGILTSRWDRVYPTG